MKILLMFDRYIPRDSRTRVGFAAKLGGDTHEFMVYGPGEDSKVSPVEYDEKITAKDLLDLTHPDVLLFLFYSPRSYDWVPKDICKLSIPSVIVEEDHYIVGRDDSVFDWYKEMNFSLLVRRHYYDEKAPMSSVWLPFSANEWEFEPTDGVRLNKIGFAGSWRSSQPAYDIRRKAISVLVESGQLDKKYGRIWGKEYTNYLQEHIGCLACTGGFLHTPLAKTFEIPLCGTAMLTNRMEEEKLLWGKDKCYFEYKDDMSDIVDVANVILNDKDQVAEVTANALREVRAKHTDEKRLIEFENILEGLIAGKEIPRIWGQ